MVKQFTKRIQAARKCIEGEQPYSLDAAVEKLAAMPQAKFDETVELSAHLAVDPRQSTQMVRGTVSLPHGSGRKIRILVFTDNPSAATEAGANYAGLDDLIQRVKDGWLDFDIAFATTSAMKKVREIARVLGPRGLMPNPKTGTVSDDLTSAIAEVKAGRVEYKMDKAANVAIVVGKRSFDASKLVKNAHAAIESLLKARPAAFKGGDYLKSLAISSTMSPGVKIDLKSCVELN